MEKLARQKTHEQEILAIADEMAESVTNFNPQSYYAFLNSRERLQHKIRDVLTEYHDK